MLSVKKIHVKGWKFKCEMAKNKKNDENQCNKTFLYDWGNFNAFYF